MPRGERGSATLEIAILGPALLLVVFAVVQVGMWAYARSLAQGAAQEGAHAAAAYGARVADGDRVARRFLERAAGDSLTGASVQASARGADRVSVTVRGRVISVIPGLSGLTVEASAEVARERFIPDLP